MTPKGNLGTTMKEFFACLAFEKEVLWLKEFPFGFYPNKNPFLENELSYDGEFVNE